MRKVAHRMQALYTPLDRSGGKQQRHQPARDLGILHREPHGLAQRAVHVELGASRCGARGPRSRARVSDCRVVGTPNAAELVDHRHDRDRVGVVETVRWPARRTPQPCGPWRSSTGDERMKSSVARANSSSTFDIAGRFRPRCRPRERRHDGERRPGLRLARRQACPVRGVAPPVPAPPRNSADQDSIETFSMLLFERRGP